MQELSETMRYVSRMTHYLRRITTSFLGIAQKSRLLYVAGSVVVVSGFAYEVVASSPMKATKSEASRITSSTPPATQHIFVQPQTIPQTNQPESPTVHVTTMHTSTQTNTSEGTSGASAVVVNGRNVPIPANGSVNKYIPGIQGNTSVHVSHSSSSSTGSAITDVQVVSTSEGTVGVTSE